MEEEGRERNKVSEGNGGGGLEWGGATFFLGRRAWVTYSVPCSIARVSPLP